MSWRQFHSQGGPPLPPLANAPGRRGAVVALLLAVLVGCERTAAPSGAASTAVRTPVPAARLVGARASLERVTIGGENRSVLPPTMRSVEITVPAQSTLDVRFAAAPAAFAGVPAIDFAVAARGDGVDRVLFTQRVERPGPQSPSAWQRATVPLDDLAGRTLTLLFSETVAGGAHAAARAHATYWTNPRVLPAHPPRPSSAGPPNIILVSIDTLRADELGAYGYPRPTSPNIDRLAAGGVLFRRAISQSSWTLPAHASLFTGLLPHRHGATVAGSVTPLAPERDTLTERLWDAGYETAGFTGGVYVTAANGFDQGFDVFKEAPLLSAMTQPFSAVVDDARAWLAEPRRDPFFLFLHNYEVHMPYEALAPYDAMFDPDYDGQFAHGISNEQWIRMGFDQGWMTDRDVQHLRARYDGAIRHVDLAFGALLDALDAQGLSDSTCIVLTADHGEEFRDHGDVGHNRAKLHEELVRVPLIIRCPSRFAAGTVVDAPVGLFDVMPTLLELASVPVSGLDARSLLPLLGGAPNDAPSRALVSECDGSVALRQGTARAVRDDRYTLITSTIPGQPSEQLFDAVADPSESLDIGPAHPATAARLRALVAAVADAAAGAVVDTPIPAPTPDAAARERLRVLGYGS